jgi:N-acylglucosamine-6-phosphate 2-epimerase
MAQAALNQGAVGVRIDSPEHIQAVRSRTTAPIIGLWKQTLPGSEVYITPQLHHAEAVVRAGADLVAIDATQRQRPAGETVADLIHHIHRLGKLVMADVDTLEAGLEAATAGADVVGTTLYGYTDCTRHFTPPGFELLTQLVNQLSIPVICEGGIASPAMAKSALELGAYSVVVGTAITGIEALVTAYCGALTAVAD